MALLFCKTRLVVLCSVFTGLLRKNSKMTMSMKLFDLDLLMVLLSCKDLLSFCSLLTRLFMYLDLDK